MADYLLDTNVISHWYDTNCAENSKVVAAVDAARQPDPGSGYVARFFVSFITYGEIEFGARSCRVPDPMKQAEYAAMDAAKRRFVREECPEELEWNRHVPEAYGELKAWLFENCSERTNRTKAKRTEQLVYPITGRELVIDENDLWIAAQAMTHDLVLVTRDRGGNFPKVLNAFSSTLRVEDWAK